MQEVLQSWLAPQCQLLGGVTHAIVWTGLPGRGPFDQVIHWPEKRAATAALIRLAQAVLRSKQPVINTRHTKGQETGEPRDTLACPILIGDQLAGVVAAEMSHRSQALQRVALQQIQAGIMWLGVMMQFHQSASKDQLANLVDLVVAGLDNDRFKAAAADVANKLGERFSCHRVSLGFRRFGRLRVEAVSHSDRVDQRTHLTRAILCAMTEAMDQGGTIVYPPTPDRGIQVTHFHKQLARLQPGSAFCTVPLVRNNKAVGALLLEREAETAFEPETMAHCEQVGLLLGPVLETRRSDERPLAAKIIDTMRRSLMKLFGPRHLPLKLASFLVAAMLTLLTLASGSFRISSDTELEAWMCQAVVAPQQGYIADAHVRAGDRVQQGQLLASLDDRDLLQERRKWQSQHNQLLKEHRKALADADRSQMAILRAIRAQAEAQLKLVEQKLERIHLKAPFAGMVASGDLSQSLGAPVECGQVLYEVAPTNDFRVVLRVDERDIGFMGAGQRGTLKLAGIPDKGLAITIDRITPVATSEGGRTYFRVEAGLEEGSDLMRPGMAGIAKIEVGREKLWWIWTRGLFNWARLFFWNRLP